MTTIHHPLTPADATVVASLRQAMSAQKGKYMGTGARQPFEAQKNGVQPADCQTTPGVVGGAVSYTHLVSRRSSLETDAQPIVSVRQSLDRPLDRQRTVLDIAEKPG